MKSKAFIIVLTILVCASLTPGNAASAPFNPDRVSNRVCLSRRQATALIRSARRDATTIKALAAARETVSVPPRINAEGDAICGTFPQSELPASYGDKVPAAFATSMDAVASYQYTQGIHDGLSFENPNVEVVVYWYAPSYVVVAFGAIGPVSGLGCESESAYRVTVKTGKVYQFDGCVEAHKHVLPSFSQLPPTK